MRVILFDLGDTLEHDDVLLPGAEETVKAVRAMRDGKDEPVAIGLVSDYTAADSASHADQLREEYYQILTALGIRSYFEPVSEHVTLSTDVGFPKPSPEIFEKAIRKLSSNGHFHQAFFVTENMAHVKAARELGMMAVHFRGPGQAKGDIKSLPELIPILRQWLAFDPCGKRNLEAVGRGASELNKSKQQDPVVKGLADKVDVSKLRESVTALAGFGTRWTYSPTIKQVPEWIRSEFLALGYNGSGETRFQPFPIPGKPSQQNVLCGAKDMSKAFILVCCHYDSISETPSTAAPGADDDASGVAVVLEAARILKGVALKRGVLFAAFGGEEQGLFGSTACAKVAAQKKWAIDVVINLDMVSFKSAGVPSKIIVEYDQGNRNPGNDAAAKAYGMVMAQAAADYTTLAVEHTDIWNSDYLPFEAKGYACIGAYNAEDNPFYHKSTDTPAHVDFDHMGQVARMIVASIAKIAG